MLRETRLQTTKPEVGISNLLRARSRYDLLRDKAMLNHDRNTYTYYYDKHTHAHAHTFYNTQ